MDPIAGVFGHTKGVDSTATVVVKGSERKRKGNKVRSHVVVVEEERGEERRQEGNPPCIAAEDLSRERGKREPVWHTAAAGQSHSSVWCSNQSAAHS